MNVEYENDLRNKLPQHLLVEPVKTHQKCHFMVAICSQDLHVGPATYTTGLLTKILLSVKSAMLDVGSVCSIMSLCMASVTEASSHGKPTLCGNRVSKCQPPGSKEALHLLKIFLRSCLKSISSFSSYIQFQSFQRMCSVDINHIVHHSL